MYSLNKSPLRILSWWYFICGYMHSLNTSLKTMMRKRHYRILLIRFIKMPISQLIHIILLHMMLILYQKPIKKVISLAAWKFKKMCKVMHTWIKIGLVNYDIHSANFSLIVNCLVISYVEFEISLSLNLSCFCAFWGLKTGNHLI